MITSGSLSRGMTRSSERRKSATPTRNTREWNGTSMPGTRMTERRPPARAPRPPFLQGFPPRKGAGDRLLRAAQVEVPDLQEFPCAVGDLGDECCYLVV